MTLLLGGLLVIAVGGALAALLSRRAAGDALFRALTLTGAAAAIVPALRVLAGGPALELRIPATIPGGAWVFGVDGLSAFFLVLVLVVGAMAAVFGTGYLPVQRRAAGVAHGVFALLLVSLALVVTARAAVPFLIAWEIMSVSAYVLVVFDHTQATVRRAGLIYLIATHTGTLLLFLLFLALGHPAPDLTFAAIAESSAAAPAATLVLLLALAGFGIKAGLVPLHFWLPGAHGAAPSHVSALMSGVVIKMGIYGLLRVLTLAGAPPAWWGWTMLAIGIASGVLGVVWALAQHDLKRLLAYHSVENIGIILIGYGMGALGVAYHAPVVAVLGFAGAILHTLNHALFKSLLFLGAGSVQHASGTRIIDRLGGLARRVPLTWLAFVVGAAAIVGLPPLNGFVSEWVVFQALLSSASSSGALRLACLGAAGLALIGALALACFAKVAGAVFLGNARSPEAAEASRDHDAALVAPLLTLAALCLTIGVAPLLVVRPALDAAAMLAGQAGAPASVAPVLAGAGVVGWVAVALLVLSAGVAAFAAWRRARLPAATGGTWACGYAGAAPRAQYTAASFAAPLLETFAPVAGVHTTRSAHALHTHPSDPVLDGALEPAWRRSVGALTVMRPERPGRLHIAILYVVATVLVLLLYLVTRSAGS